MDGGADSKAGGADTEDVLCGRVGSVPVLRSHPCGSAKEGGDTYDAYFPGGIEPFPVIVEVG